MLYSLLSASEGFHQKNTVADEVGPRNVDYAMEEKEMFWEHCVKVIGV